MDFSDLEKTILNRIQRDFPLSRDPFEEMASELHMSGAEFLDSLRSLKARSIIRTIAGIFNAGRLGYISLLAAFQVDDGRVDEAAGIINSHPGVSHNYLRDHRYNIWFTLAADSREKIDKAVQYLAERAGAASYLVLRNERLFKIGVFLDTGCGDSPAPAHAAPSISPADAGEKDLSREQKEAIRLLQADLPLFPGPFGRLIDENAGLINEDDLLDYSRSLMQEGVMRRYSAVLRHVQAGYTANALTVWKPGTGADIDRVAGIFHARTLVSHLYLRSAWPDEWDYPLFAMIHGRTDEELSRVIRELSRESGLAQYQVLRTMREFKKERVVYFSPRFKEWEDEAGI
ncbi:MAG: hypothetical protein A2W19_04585 [Spirochaetes bacterium RBG_16_49_21]|nr:MAG: hypothetical protein A2W19_04585 [Spirochaetes bacterium RBG_16_49_21]